MSSPGCAMQAALAKWKSGLAARQQSHDPCLHVGFTASATSTNSSSGSSSTSLRGSGNWHACKAGVVSLLPKDKPCLYKLCGLAGSFLPPVEGGSIWPVSLLAVSALHLLSVCVCRAMCISCLFPPCKGPRVCVRVCVRVCGALCVPVAPTADSCLCVSSATAQVRRLWVLTTFSTPPPPWACPPAGGRAWMSWTRLQPPFVAPAGHTSGHTTSKITRGTRQIRTMQRWGFSGVWRRTPLGSVGLGVRHQHRPDTNGTLVSAICRPACLPCLPTRTHRDSCLPLPCLRVSLVQVCFSAALILGLLAQGLHLPTTTPLLVASNSITTPQGEALEAKWPLGALVVGLLHSRGAGLKGPFSLNPKASGARKTLTPKHHRTHDHPMLGAAGGEAEAGGLTPGSAAVVAGLFCLSCLAMTLALSWIGVGLPGHGRVGMLWHRLHWALGRPLLGPRRPTTSGGAGPGVSGGSGGEGSWDSVRYLRVRPQSRGARSRSGSPARRGEDSSATAGRTVAGSSVMLAVLPVSTSAVVNGAAPVAAAEGVSSGAGQPAIWPLTARQR